MSFASHLNTNSFTAQEPLRFLPSPRLLALPRLFPSLPLPSPPCILPLVGLDRLPDGGSASLGPAWPEEPTHWL